MSYTDISPFLQNFSFTAGSLIPGSHLDQSEASFTKPFGDQWELSRSVSEDSPEMHLLVNGHVSRFSNLKYKEVTFKGSDLWNEVGARN